ncbi:MAG: glycosyltransferase family 4 protein [Thermodesulfobacteriota bacterium]
MAFEAFPRPKGAAAHIETMLLALARDYAPVWFFCLGFADMPGLQFEDGVVIHRLKHHHPNLLRRAAEFADFVYSRLAGLESPPGLLVYRDPWSGWPASSALPEVPAIFEVNALPGWELPYTHPAVRSNPALLAKIEQLEWFCLRSARAVIAVSEVTREALTDLGLEGQRIFVAPNAATEAFFQAGRVEIPLEVLSQGRWFGYFGGLHPWQGVETLIEAWALTASEWPEVRLLIIHAGRREAARNLRKLIARRGLAGRVVLQSPLPTERLAGVTARLEFTCAPLTETFRNIVQGCCPIKIVESMAAGVPVLASDLRVTRALIAHGRDGFLARPDSPRSWAQAIRKMLQDVELRRRLGAAAGESARQKFSRSAVFPRLREIFQSAARTR